MVSAWSQTRDHSAVSGITNGHGQRTFLEFDPTEADPPAWIAAGAVPITVLAGSNLLLAAPGSPMSW